MEIRPSQPNAIQRLIGIAVGFTKILKPPRIASIKGILIREELVRVGVEAMRVGADFVDRCHGSGLGAAESVAGGAMLSIKRFTGFGQLFVYRIGINWCSESEQPVLHSL